jgi:hypothetical protein
MDDIESFEKLDVAVLMQHRGEDFWIVSKYTEVDRVEISIRDLDKILRCAEVFGVEKAREFLNRKPNRRR